MDQKQAKFIQLTQPRVERLEEAARILGHMGSSRYIKDPETLRDAETRILDTFLTLAETLGITLTLDRAENTANKDLVQLPNARLVRQSEPEQDEREKEVSLKLLTDPPTVTVKDPSDLNEIHTNHERDQSDMARSYTAWALECLNRGHLEDAKAHLKTALNNGKVILEGAA